MAKTDNLTKPALQGKQGEITAVCSAMRYIVDPPKSPLKSRANSL